MKKFLYSLSILSIILLGVTLLVFNLLSFVLPIIVYFFFLYFFVLTLVSHFMLVKKNKENPKRFVTSFMGVMGIKLFASLAFIAITLIVFKSAEFVIELALTFGALYLIYTFFETVQLLRATKETTTNIND